MSGPNWSTFGGNGPAGVVASTRLGGATAGAPGVTTGGVVDVVSAMGSPYRVKVGAPRSSGPREGPPPSPGRSTPQPGTGPKDTVRPADPWVEQRMDQGRLAIVFVSHGAVAAGGCGSRARAHAGGAHPRRPPERYGHRRQAALRANRSGTGPASGLLRLHLAGTTTVSPTSWRSIRAPAQRCQHSQPGWSVAARCCRVVVTVHHCRGVDAAPMWRVLPSVCPAYCSNCWASAMISSRRAEGCSTTKG